MVANVGVFLVGFLPLSGRVSLWILEPAVVIVDAVIIKIVASASIFQASNYMGVSWLRGLLASVLGNASSFFIGSHAPWITHETVTAE